MTENRVGGVDDEKRSLRSRIDRDAIGILFATQVWVVALALIYVAIFAPLRDDTPSWIFVYSTMASWVWSLSFPFFAGLGKTKKDWRIGFSPVPTALLVPAALPCLPTILGLKILVSLWLVQGAFALASHAAAHRLPRQRTDQPAFGR